MRKYKIISIIAMIVIYIVLNIAIFLNVSNNRFDDTSFWVAWVFAFPINLIVSLLILFFTSKTDKNDRVTTPALSYLLFVFNIMYLVIGTCLMSIESNLSIVIAIEVVVTVLYFSIFMFVSFETKSIRNEIIHTEEKLLYIKEMQLSLREAILSMDNSALKTHTYNLVKKISLSNPMSDDSLKELELEIKSLVDSIIIKINSKDYNELGSMVDLALEKLEERNSKCK